MTSETLRACPFCGGAPYPTEEDGPIGAVPIIACRDCGAQGGGELDVSDAKNWQSRSLPAALDVVIREVEKQDADALYEMWSSVAVRGSFKDELLASLRALRAADTAPETQDE